MRSNYLLMAGLSTLTVLSRLDDMAGMLKSTITAQAAEFIREGILQGKWRQFLPGRDLLASDLGVSHMTVDLLKGEDLVVDQGNGRRRRILLSESGLQSKCLRIAVLGFESEDIQLFYVVDFVHRLREAGNQVDFSDNTQSGL